MNERQLRYIHAIAKERSILKASLFLNKNPSTITRVLKHCEEELTVSLFNRTRAGMVPTAEGERVVELSEKILSELDRIEEWAGQASHSWKEQEIRYLLAVREYRNISKAAKELYMAQPSLSQTIKELEETLGSLIFMRKKDGVKETRFGHELLNRLESVGACYRELEVELEEFRQMRKGAVTLGIPLNLGAYLLPAVVPPFRQRFPGIKIQIRENNSSELERLMIAGKLDFCVLHFHEKLEQVEYEMFFEEPFCLVIPKSAKSRLHLPQDRELTKEDFLKLAQEPFVMVSARQKLRQVADGILKNAGIVPDICCTTKSMETAKRLAAAGMGMTLLPRSYLNLYSGVEGLECYPLSPDLKGSWKLTVAYPKEKKLSRGSREFLKVIKETLSEL
ncbi:MAG: LysR family transcriptional regulator [Hungatella sp.]|nr:LysR family transcriptional regulator [Hungatella sp.]